MRSVRGRQCCWWVLGLLWAAVALAADQVEVRMTAGFGDVVPARGRLVPVQVIINNPVHQTQGRIILTNGEVSESYPFQSPQQSIMRFNLLTRVACEQYQLRVRVEFEDSDMQPRWRDDFRLVRGRLPILYVGVPASYHQALPEGVQPHYQAILCPPAELPREAAALDSVAMVVITGLRFMELGREQVQALGEWVRHTGGRLIILSPPQEEQFGNQMMHLIQGRWVPSKVLAPYGAGLLVLDTDGLSLGRPWWLSDEEARKRFLPALFVLNEENQPDDCGMGDGSGMLSDITRRHGAYGMSGFIWLTLIMGSYLLVIGPLDWFITRKTRKPQLTWPIFLGAIVVFSLIAYLYSSLVHSGPTQGFQMQVVDMAEDQPVGRGRALLWLYSTRNAQYTFASTRPTAVFSARPAGTGAITAGLGVRIFQGDQPSLRAQIPVFSDRQFNAAWTQPMKSPVIWQDKQQTRFTVAKGYRLFGGHALTADGHWRVEPVPHEAGVWQLLPAESVETFLSYLRNTYGRANGYQGNSELSREKLPDQAVMEGYLLALSLEAGLPEKNQYGYSGQPNAEERSLVLPAWPPPAGQRLLLLFVTPDEPWLGVDVSPSIPENKTINLLRLYQRDPSKESP
jgi:hypothetical protein